MKKTGAQIVCESMINEGVDVMFGFPGGVLLVAKENVILFHKAYGYANLYTKQPMTRDTIFDLASLTKPLATTLASTHLE